MFKKGLAYKKEMAVNWCTSCKVVLANEGVLLLHVEDVIVGVERVERYGLLFRVGEIHAVRSACLAPDHAAQALIGVSRVHQYHMRALLIILAHEVVHEERLAAARRTQHELVAVRGDTPLHG